MAKVYYSKNINKDTIKKLAEIILAEFNLEKKDRTAVKVHFGERGQSRMVSPENILPIVEELKKINSNMFVTDTNTLYRGMRTNATNHVKIAKEHGFDKLNIPIIIADGENGADEVEIEVNQDHFETVRIGKEIVDSDALVFVSHFKGHQLFSFGGTIKNIAMGCGSRAGKLAMHSMIKPSINHTTCTGCGICVKHCDFDAITVDKETKKASINHDKCSGCAICISVCPEHAAAVPWHGASPIDAMERGAEYALGAIKGKKCVYFNFANNITEHCDCARDSNIIAKDVGVFASLDPVSIDKATFDMVKEKNDGRDIFKDLDRADGTHIFSYGEMIGLGEKSYELIEID